MVERPGQEQAEASQPSLHSLVQTTVSLSLFQQGRAHSWSDVSDCVLKKEGKRRGGEGRGGEGRGGEGRRGEGRGGELKCTKYR